MHHINRTEEEKVHDLEDVRKSLMEKREILMELRGDETQNTYERFGVW